MRKLNLYDFSFVGAAGLFERSFIGWTEDLVVSSLCKNPNYVDIVGFLNNVCVRITFVYGRWELWDQVRLWDLW